MFEIRDPGLLLVPDQIGLFKIYFDINNFNNYNVIIKGIYSNFDIWYEI